MAHSLGFYGNGISLCVVFGWSFWFRVLPGGTCIAWPRWMSVRRILGCAQSHGVSFWPILNSFGWFSPVQSLSHVQLFVTPWAAACQASLSIINTQILLKLMSIELVMPPNHVILCRPLLLLPSIFPSIRSFQMSQLLTSGVQNIGASASASALLMNSQDWFPLWRTGWISLQSKELSSIFSNTTVQKCPQLSL